LKRQEEGTNRGMVDAKGKERLDFFLLLDLLVSQISRKL
jgi:hypothetical protein